MSNETLQLAALAGTLVGSTTWQTPTGWIVRPPSLAVQWLSSGPITTPDGESAPVLAPPPSGAAAVPLHAAPASAAATKKRARETEMRYFGMGLSFAAVTVVVFHG